MQYGRQQCLCVFHAAFWQSALQSVAVLAAQPPSRGKSWSGPVHVQARSSFHVSSSGVEDARSHLHHLVRPVLRGSEATLGPGTNGDLHDSRDTADIDETLVRFEGHLAEGVMQGLHAALRVAWRCRAPPQYGVPYSMGWFRPSVI